MSKSNDLDQLLQFTQFNHAFRDVKRQVYAVGSEQFENDAEHSCQLALTCWYLANSLKLDLDTAKVLEYALAHDLVETYAGDTGFFTADPEYRDSQAVREASAAVRISEEFPQFTQLHQIIDDFQRQADDEAQFVHAVDKLVPVINNYLDGGRSWQKQNLTANQVIEGKDPHIKLSRPVNALWQEVKKLLIANEGELFKQAKPKSRGKRVK